jgi:hypothetical protein
MSNRREFLLASLGATAWWHVMPLQLRKLRSRSFHLWAFGDAHVSADEANGRESLAEAFVQSEFGDKNGAPPFDWDIAIDVGDMSASQGLPVDAEGEGIVRQFRALKKHRREDIYDVSGNHDRSGPNEPDAWWWQKWIDPLGQNTKFSGVDSAKRPYPIEGTWERYSFRVGNLLFLMMSDRNEPSQKIGRGTLGGNPGGVVSGETFSWWRKMVEANPESIIISVHHYVLKNTTVASGEWEGMKKDENGNWTSIITAISNKVLRKEHPIFIGLTANPTLKPLRSISKLIRAQFRCGSADIRTPIPTIHMAGNPTLRRNGAYTS